MSSCHRCRRSEKLKEMEDQLNFLEKERERIATEMEKHQQAKSKHIEDRDNLLHQVYRIFAYAFSKQDCQGWPHR